VSLTLRLSLLFHEVRSRIGASLPVAIGAPITFEALAQFHDRQALVDNLYGRVYALAGREPAAGNTAASAREPFKAVRSALKIARAV